MNLTKNWKKEIKEVWGIEFLADPEKAPSDVLWTTRCSKTKNCDGGLPQDFYVSPLNRLFYAFAREHGKRYAVISDKYGLHFDCERLPYYDVHPSNLSEKQKKLLGKKIRGKALAQGFNTIIFYNNSPLRSAPYFEILSKTGLAVLFVTRLLQCAKNHRRITP